MVLEYCDGGDLAAYIHKHGKVSEAVARHFMRQLGISIFTFWLFKFSIKFPVIKVRQFWQILYALAVCLLNAQLLLNEFFEMLGQFELGVR